jgi:DMSO/TMAO reductase YedYZ molybdopterin-dependent catalytic subunit
MFGVSPATRRRLTATLTWGVVAVAVGFAAVAGSFAAVGRTPAFAVTPLDGIVSTYTPGVLVTFAITVLGDIGHQLAFGLAIGATAVLLGLVAAPGVYALRAGRGPVAVALGATLPAMAALALTGSLPSAGGAAAGAGLVLAVAVLFPDVENTPVSGARREVLGAVGAAAGVGAVGSLLGGSGRTDPAVASVPEDARENVRTRLREASERSLDVSGLEPLVSDQFYQVDINNINPDVDTDSWSLSVTGAVDEPKTVDFADLEAMEPRDRFSTLRCVGDDLNGRKLDNALWTGVPMAEVLEDVELQGEFVMLRAEDGFFEEFPVEALRTGFLAYGMNGRDLPRKHGAPVRALIPGHWGEINVKWLNEIEILDRPAKGYWEKRGWQGTGPVKTVAKLWVTNHLEDGRTELAGVAHAGVDGIQRVEVSVDGGESWNRATLSEPLEDPDVWRQWVYRYEKSEKHTAVVRAVDGNGVTQTEKTTGAVPSGPTGWVSTTVMP